jgi:hypothetical protein
MRAGYFFLTITDPETFRKGLGLIIGQGSRLGFVTAGAVDDAAAHGCSQSM